MKKLLLLLLFIFSFAATNSHAAKLEDYLDRKEVQKRIRDSIANQDISFDQSLGNIDLVNGINLSSKYRYNVESSYINKFYSRIDKWDINAGVNVGEVLKDLVDIPFGFSINRATSFFFVRQFPDKKVAMKALPYGPLNLPLNAKLALKNLSPGDFVSMPANLTVACSIGASMVTTSPVVVGASAGAALVLSGEFTIQVFKIDQTHIRLKLITQRGRSAGGSIAAGANFQFFGIGILNHEIDRLFERDLLQLGYGYSPGSQFIIDYIFDLSKPEAQEAYDRILSSTFKFKDLIVADMLDGRDLKDKLISSYEKADELFIADGKLDPKDRRVQRVFKGFSNYQGHSRHLKLSLLLTSYTKDRTYSESKVTFVDKNENNLEFFYPSYSKFIESHLDKWFFDLKDQSFQTNFGLIPRFNSEDAKTKNPDLGLTFERKDSSFTEYEQKTVERFMFSEVPQVLLKNIDLTGWKDRTKKKYDSRVFFQLVLKSQGFEYLKDISPLEMKEKILLYVDSKRQENIIDDFESHPPLEKLRDFLMLNRFIKKSKLIDLAEKLAVILKNENHSSEDMLKKLVALNEGGVFDKIGVGFLISLLPQDKLQDLIYFKLDMMAKDLKPVAAEVGTLNYRALYKELTEVQSRLSNRSYDLRISDQDRNMGDLDINNL